MEAQKNCERLARSKNSLARKVEEAESKTDLILQEAQSLTVAESRKELSLITKIAQMERKKVLEATREHRGFTDESYLDLEGRASPRRPPERERSSSFEPEQE